MRRNAITSAVQEESDEINLTPMLDVVFIMLIFFIVTANFIKEPGLEINRPDSDTAETQENAAILIAVGPTGEVWMDGRRIDVRQVKANVVKLLADNPQGSVVIQADEKSYGRHHYSSYGWRKRSRCKRNIISIRTKVIKYGSNYLSNKVCTKTSTVFI
jgi:biopolymer transport protein ExbD